MRPPSDDLLALEQRVWGSFIGRCVQRFIAMAGIDRFIVLSSQAFTALIPLLLLVSTLAPAGHEDLISQSLIKKFGLSGDSAAAFERLFTVPTGTSSSLSIFSAFLLLFSGVSFTRRLQRMYRSAWNQDKIPIRSGIYAALGLVTLLVEVGALYTIRTLVGHLPFGWLVEIPIGAVAGLALWTALSYLLLDRAVHWRRLLVAGGIVALGTTIYSVATAIYMPGLVEQYVSEMGLFGITIAILGWLLGISGVLVVGSAIGAEFDMSRDRWALALKERFRLEDPTMERPPLSEAAEGTHLTASDLLLLVRVLVNWLVIAAGVWVAAYVVPGITVTGGFLTYLWLSLLFGLVNAVLGPLLRLVALPLTVLTLGLIALVTNGILLAVTALLSSNLQLGGFGTAVVGALVISVVTTLIELVLRPIRETRDQLFAPDRKDNAPPG